MNIVELAKSYLLGSHECERCGHIAPQNGCDNPVIYGTDPYAEEILGDYTSFWLCDNCLYDSAMDI